MTTTADFDTENLPPPNGNGTPPSRDEQKVNYDELFTPEAADFIKRAKTATAREYEKKTQAALNTLMQNSLRHPETLPDAAAIIKYGQNFATATGVLADSDEKAAKMIDMIMSPSSPYVAFAVAAVPLIAQIYRNHQPQIQEIAAKRKGAPKLSRAERKAQRQAKRDAMPGIKFTVPVLKRAVEFKFPVKALGMGRDFLENNSKEPDAITHEIFSNPDVLKALHKRGLKIGA